LAERKDPPATLKPGPFDENMLGQDGPGIRCINSVALAPIGSREEILARLDKFIAYAKASYGDNPCC